MIIKNRNIAYIIIVFMGSTLINIDAYADNHFNHVTDLQLSDINNKIQNYKLPFLSQIFVAENASQKDVKVALESELNKAGIDIGLFYLAHLERNRLQEKVPVAQLVDSNSNPPKPLSGYKFVDPDRSVFHRIGLGNFNNKKIISTDGKSEYILQPYRNTYRIVDNSVNKGTYNFYSPDNEKAHFMWDVLPWILWGNGGKDDTNFEWRKTTFIYSVYGYKSYLPKAKIKLLELMDNCQCDYASGNNTPSPIQLNPFPAPPELVIIPPLQHAPPKWTGQFSLSGGTGSNLFAARSGMDVSGLSPLDDPISFSDDNGGLSAPIVLSDYSKSGLGHSFSHFVFGKWSGNNKTFTRSSDNKTFSNIGGHYVYGEAMPERARSGTATYTGQIIGDYVDKETNTVERNVIGGHLGITANFANSKLDGWMSFTKNGEDGNLVTDMKNANIYVKDGVTGFRAGLAADDIKGGGVGGQFFGPNGTELGGSWWLDTYDGDASGIFAARETKTMPEKPEDTRSDDDNGNTFVGISTVSRKHAVFTGRLNMVENPADGDGVGFTIGVSPDQGGGSVKTTEKFSIGNYSYTNWGKWTASEFTPIYYQAGGYWVSGSKTPRNVIHEKTGTASYSGNMVGNYMVGGGGARQDAHGLIELNADFSSNTLTGRMGWGHGGSGTYYGSDSRTQVNDIVAKFSDNGAFSMQSTSDDSSTTSLSTADVKYGLSGQFLGDDGQEIAGTSWMHTGEGSYSGVFRAKK